MDRPVPTEDFPYNSKCSPLLRSYWKNLKYATQQCNSKIERLDADFAELIQERFSAIRLNEEMGRASYNRDCSIFENNPVAVDLIYQKHYRVWEISMMKFYHENAGLSSSYWQVRMGYLNEWQRVTEMHKLVFPYAVHEERLDRKDKKKKRKAVAAAKKNTRKMDYETQAYVNEFSRELRREVWRSTHSTRQARPVNFSDPDPEILFSPN
jgi:hypothetical protein